MSKRLKILKILKKRKMMTNLNPMKKLLKRYGLQHLMSPRKRKRKKAKNE